MPRLFIALPVSDDVRNAAGNLLLPQDNFIRKTPLAELHVTLHFLGETTDVEFERVKCELASVRHTAFQLTFSGTGHFPPSATAVSQSGRARSGKSNEPDNSPRVLWIAVQPSEALMTLHSQLEQTLQAAGFKTEERAYHPHLTIARIKPDSGQITASQAAEQFERDNSGFHVVQPVDRFLLYSVARENVQGSRYHVEREYLLGS